MNGNGISVKKKSSEQQSGLDWKTLLLHWWEIRYIHYAELNVNLTCPVLNS